MDASLAGQICPVPPAQVAQMTETFGQYRAIARNATSHECSRSGDFLRRLAPSWHSTRCIESHDCLSMARDRAYDGCISLLVDDHRIERLAAWFRGSARPPYDPWDLAREHGIRVVTRKLTPTFLGATLPSGTVVINADLPGVRQRTVLAHEFGHIVVRQGRAPWVNQRSEEHFADRFGEELLVPLALLPADDLNVQAVSDRLAVEEVLLMTRLVRAGRAPGVVVHQTGVVICRSCGTRAGNPSCSCANYRCAVGSDGSSSA